MRYSLDPHIHTILGWRTDQNIVLDILLNEIMYVSEDKRRFLPYRLSITPEARTLTDQSGRVVCEFSMLSGGIIMVDRIRSWDDYIEMDKVGQTLREERVDERRTPIIEL